MYGEKTEVPDAVGASQLFVSAADGIYLVDAAAPGVGIAALDCVDGSRRLGRLRLDGAPATRVGPLAALSPVLDRMLVTLCAAGIAQWFAGNRFWMKLQNQVMGMVLGALAVRLLFQQRTPA